jgi:hypothetical protein
MSCLERRSCKLAKHWQVQLGKAKHDAERCLYGNPEASTVMISSTKGKESVDILGLAGVDACIVHA